MEEKTWSDEQQAAINSVDKDTLVSASAGSGKTELMMEKVARMVVGGIKGHEKECTPIKKMMIVTFTKAVARELKVRVVSKLTETMQKPGVDRKNIIRQIEDVAIANISTIDSLCTNIVRTYFDAAGVDPTFTIMDEDESKLYLNRAIKKVLEEENTMMHQEYIDLKALLGDGIVESLRTAYSFVRNKPRYLSYLNDVKDGPTNQYIGDNFENGKLLERYIEKHNQKAQKIIAKVLDYEAKATKTFPDGGAKDSVINKLEFTRDGMQLIAKAKTLQDLQTAIVLYTTSKAPSFPNKGFSGDDEIALYQEIQEFMKPIAPIKFLSSSIFKSTDVLESLDSIPEDKVLLDAFISLLVKVDAIYVAQKQEDNRLDFNDVEQKTITVLDNETLQKELKEKFDYICVDEYQDINSLQDLILNRLSRGNNLFMVGDIKQSIYGFRLSEPTIFLEKYDAFKEDTSIGTNVNLNINYRSKSEILDFVNDVFNENMTDEFGHINYKDTANLKAFYKNESTGVDRVKIKMFKKESNDEDYLALPKDNIYSVKEHVNAQEDNSVNAEAQYIIKTIKSLISGAKILSNGQQIQYKDIAILFRSRSDRAKAIVKEIQKAGIPIDTSNAFTETKNLAISTIISLLNIIDNDKQDIELANVLLSTFGSFTMAELAKIRKQSRKSEFFHEAFALYENNDDVYRKIKDFRKMLEEYRFKAKYMSVDELVKDIIDKYNYEDYVLAQENGEATLNQVKTFINSLENKSYNSSISRFLSIYREYSSIDETKEASQSSDNCVQTATVHASKGLQYPVVFLIDVGAQFKGDSGDVVCHKEYGFAIKHLNKEGLKIDDSYIFKAIRQEKDNETLEENLRGLYVAITRPKEYLYITGTKDNLDSVKEPEDAKCYFDWLNYAKDNNPSFKQKYFDLTDFEADEKCSDETQVVDMASLKQNPTFDEEFLPLILNEYKHKESTTTPIWYSVTQINKNNSKELDEEFEGGMVDFEKFFDFESDQKEQIKKTSKESGTAYHKVLELIDYKSVFTIEDVKDAILDMYKQDILSEEQYDAINPNVIYEFLNNDFIKSLKGYNWKREESFKLYMKACDAFDTKVEDKILIQGTYDLFIPEKNMLIDYKFSKDTPENIKNTYTKQLNLYKKAIEACTPYQVDEMYIYVIGQNIKIKI